MNEHDLDAAIDDVAREMTAGDLDGAFRARVLGRIEAQCKVRGSWFSVLGSRFGVRGSRFVVLGSGFAAAAMVVAAVSDVPRPARTRNHREPDCARPGCAGCSSRIVASGFSRTCGGASFSPAEAGRHG